MNIKGRPRGKWWYKSLYPAFPEIPLQNSSCQLGTFANRRPQACRNLVTKHINLMEFRIHVELVAHFARPGIGGSLGWICGYEAIELFKVLFHQMR